MHQRLEVSEDFNWDADMLAEDADHSDTAPAQYPGEEGLHEVATYYLRAINQPDWTVPGSEYLSEMKPRIYYQRWGG